MKVKLKIYLRKRHIKEKNSAFPTYKLLTLILQEAIWKDKCNHAIAIT